MAAAPTVPASQDAGGRFSRAWRATTAWIGRHRILSAAIGLALVVIGVLLFKYAITPNYEGCPKFLPCTGPDEAVSKGWQGAVLGTIGIATAIVGALTAFLSALGKLVLAGRGLWHDVRPESSKPAPRKRRRHR